MRPTPESGASWLSPTILQPQLDWAGEPAPVPASPPPALASPAPASGAPLSGEGDGPADWHVPAVLSVELHFMPDGHPLPPLPRQPATQACAVVSHTWPDVASPQSLSAVQPHVSLARHTGPAPLPAQFPVWLGVHSTHR